MFGQKNWLVILVKAHELEIFGHDSKVSTVLTIPTTVINNLEILDRDGLYSLVANWAKTLTYQATEIIWILSSSVVFEQTFADSDKERWDTLIVQFLDAVPFEEILSKTYNPAGGKSVIATNQDLLTGLNQAFAAQGYTTKVVVSGKMAGVENNLTPDLVKKVLGNMTQLYRENLVIPDEEKSNFVPGTPSVSAGAVPAKPKSQLPLLLSVFGVLLAILAIVIYLNQ